MSNKRFNGLSFDFNLGDFRINAKKFSLDITDNSTFAKRDGRPNGFLVGDVEATGTITLDRDGLGKFTEAARAAGSFQDLEPFDITAYAKAGDDYIVIKAYGCRVKLNKLLNVDTSSTDETEFELPFDVTAPEFVEIDGVPYCAKKETDM